MIVYFLYTPFALAASVLLFYTARGALRGYGNGRLIPLAFLLSASLIGSLYLLFGVASPWSRWAAVASVAVCVVPLLLPVAGMLIAVVYAKLTGEHIRWN